jgi:ubiquinone/menaquinone biosynthesis C-methylase UbiE
VANWYQKNIVPRLLNSVMGSKDFEKLRSVVLEQATGIVLEIGVGPGYNFPFYKNITKLYALEPSKELIEIAQTRSGSLTYPIAYVNTGAENIPLPDCSVDTVISTWTLCSVSDPSSVLQEVRRVLKPGGKFVFVDHGASPNVVIRVLQSISTAITKYFTGNCHYDRQLAKLISEAGFSITQMEHPSERFKPLLYNYQGVAIPA